MPPPLMGDGDVFRKDGNADGDGSRNRNGNSPVLLEAVNKNGLVLFLIVSPLYPRCNSISLNLRVTHRPI